MKLEQYTPEILETTARELLESGELPGIDLAGATIKARGILLIFYDRVDRWQYLKNLHSRDWDLFFKHTTIGAMRLLEFPEVCLLEEQKSGIIISVPRGLGKMDTSKLLNAFKETILRNEQFQLFGKIKKTECQPEVTHVFGKASLF